jgi:hypothetical protein
VFAFQIGEKHQQNNMLLDYICGFSALLNTVAGAKRGKLNEN